MKFTLTPWGYCWSPHSPGLSSRTLKNLAFNIPRWGETERQKRQRLLVMRLFEESSYLFKKVRALWKVRAPGHINQTISRKVGNHWIITCISTFGDMMLRPDCILKGDTAPECLCFTLDWCEKSGHNRSDIIKRLSNTDSSVLVFMQEWVACHSVEEIR